MRDHHARKDTSLTQRVAVEMAERFGLQVDYFGPESGDEGESAA